MFATKLIRAETVHEETCGSLRGPKKAAVDVIIANIAIRPTENSP